MKNKNIILENLKNQIAQKESQLEEMGKCKSFIINNLDDEPELRFAIWDMIAQAMDRKESEIRGLREAVIGII